MKKVISIALGGLLALSPIAQAATIDPARPAYSHNAIDWQMPMNSNFDTSAKAKTVATVIDNTETEITFQIGDDTLRINGKDIAVTAPFEEDGTTLVPLRVISEAFNAKVDWLESEQKITLTYDGTVIEIWIDRTEAITNGKSATMLKTPILKNDTTMVPLRFISENFGAMVSYDDATARVTVKKLNICPLSTVNYNPIINSDKEFIGDSYAKWFTKLPEGFKTTYRNFDGSLYRFENGSSSIEFHIKALEEKTADDMYKDLQQQYKNDTIMDKTNAVFNGRDYKTLTVIGNDKYDKVYMTVLDNLAYIFTLHTGSQNDFTSNKESYEGILGNLKLGSFSTQSAADYTNVDAQNFREYRNKISGLSIKVPADWKLEEETNYANIHFSYKKGDNYINLYYGVNKNTNNFTPSALQNSIKPSLAAQFNEKYLTINDNSSFGQGDVQGAKLDMDAEARNMYFGTKAILAVSGSYFVNMQMLLEGKKKTDFDQKLMTQVWNSVNLSQVDSNKLIIVDNGNTGTDEPGDSTKTVDLQKTKVSFTMDPKWEVKENEKYQQGSQGAPNMYLSSFYNPAAISNLTVLTYELSMSAIQAKSQIEAIQNAIKNGKGIKEYDALAEQKIVDNTFWISTYVAEDDTYDFAITEFFAFSPTGISPSTYSTKTLHRFIFETPDIFCGDMFLYHMGEVMQKVIIK